MWAGICNRYRLSEYRYFVSSVGTSKKKLHAVLVESKLLLSGGNG